MLTPQNPQRARFDLFVKLKPGIVSHYPDRKRTWCYRGDKFTNDESKMLKNLIQLAIKRIDQLEVLELYDNRLPMDSDSRTILKISSGIVEKNRLQYYQDLVQSMVIPETYKAIVYANKTNQG